MIINFLLFYFIVGIVFALIVYFTIKDRKCKDKTFYAVVIFTIFVWPRGVLGIFKNKNTSEEINKDIELGLEYLDDNL